VGKNFRKALGHTRLAIAFVDASSGIKPDSSCPSSCGSSHPLNIVFEPIW
jgi:hypothetical protein